ncbi:MAG TPA: lipopolysaccharide heptosyltransferase II [Candidatus Helicobacter avicola]|nr:lipopolysaccharide heptosyltransferase II [Candidatus Helicobacter avicola]
MTQTILLRLPNWLGDSVMCASAFEKLKIMYPKAQFVLVGSYVCEVFRRDKRVRAIYLDESKRAKNRLLNLYRLCRQIRTEIGDIDLSFCFSNGFFGALLLYLCKAKVRVGYAKNLRSPLLTHALTPPTLTPLHQVQKYEYLIKDFVDSTIFTSFVPLSLVRGDESKITHNTKKHIGINPGAAFGWAKCWEKEYFVEIITRFVSRGWEVYIFGDTKNLTTQSNEHIYDLSNQTTLTELIDSIGALDLFITNDSGPMHIAAALHTPTIAIFGSTDTADTCPWNEKIAKEFFLPMHALLERKNVLDSTHTPKDITTFEALTADNLTILSKHLQCAPCKKRTCPLKHHLCMKLLTPDEVFKSALSVLEKSPHTKEF